MKKKIIFLFELKTDVAFSSIQSSSFIYNKIISYHDVTSATFSANDFSFYHFAQKNQKQNSRLSAGLLNKNLIARTRFLTEPRQSSELSNYYQIDFIVRYKRILCIQFNRIRTILFFD